MSTHATLLELALPDDSLQDYFEQQGWTDGLPIVAPTPERVAAMVAGSGLAGDSDIAAIAPGYALCSIEKLAINAVMAGCKPSYMPVLIAALKAMAVPHFNLSGIQSTTHPVAPSFPSKTSNIFRISGAVRFLLSVRISHSTATPPAA